MTYSVLRIICKTVLFPVTVFLSLIVLYWHCLVTLLDFISISDKEKFKEEAQLNWEVSKKCIKDFIF